MARKRNTPANDIVANVATEIEAAEFNPAINDGDAELNAMLEEAIATEDTPVEEIEAVVHSLEAYEDAAVEEALASLEAEPEVEAPNAVDFLDLVPASNAEVTKEMRQEMASAIDVRLAFEERKSVETGKDNIFRTLSKTRAKLVTSAAPAQTFVAVGIRDAGFFNRVLHDGSRYNVYAAGKLADLCEGLVNTALSNAINRAIVKSLFAVTAAGGEFTMELAKAACSKQYRVDSPYAKNLVRHTVSTSTAPTQASSTMQALQTLGIVRLSGSRKNATYTVVDSPATRRLKEVAMAA